MKFEIKRWYDEKILWSGEAECLKDAIEKAVQAQASLDGASLDGASLDGASLVGAILVGASLDRASLDGARLDGARLDRASLDGASLDGASLVGARLDGARLDRASLVGASLVGASLVGARLGRASLDPIRDDVFAVLGSAPNEVLGLLRLLRDGKVDGSVYEGECACLVGSIANIRGVEYRELGDLRPDSTRAAERWFLAIRKGDTPDTSAVSRITVGWVERWLTDHGQAIPPRFTPGAAGGR